MKKLLVLLLLAGCSAAPKPQSYNDTDVMYLQMMVPHTEQSRQIAQLAARHQPRAEVAMLAAAIDATEADEVTALAGWLRTWGQPATAPTDAHAAHGGMPGTSAGEIAIVDRTTGADFEHRFLDMLIAHQDDAVQLARMELAGGTDPAVRNLAVQVDRSRSAEIQQMLAYLRA